MDKTILFQISLAVYLKKKYKPISLSTNFLLSLVHISSFINEVWKLLFFFDQSFKSHSSYSPHVYRITDRNVYCFTKRWIVFFLKNIWFIDTFLEVPFSHIQVFHFSNFTVQSIFKLENFERPFFSFFKNLIIRPGPLTLDLYKVQIFL